MSIEELCFWVEETMRYSEAVAQQSDLGEM